MNFKAAWKKLTTPSAIIEEKEVAIQKKEADLNFNQQQIDAAWSEWLKHPCSVSLQQELSICHHNNLERAKQLSVSPIPNNHEIHIHLIKADALEKVINYVRTGK